MLARSLAAPGVLLCTFSFPQRQERVWIFLTKLNSAFDRAGIVSVKVQGLGFVLFFLILCVNGKNRMESYFWAALMRNN